MCRYLLVENGGAKMSMAIRVYVLPAEFEISFKIQVNHSKVALNDKSILN